MQDYIDIRKLPKHTHKEVIFGKIKDVVLGRSEGFTVKPNLDYPRKGYLVGTGWQEKHFTESSLSTARNHINQMFNTIGDKQGLYIGGWSYEGKCIVEISEGFNNLENAIEVGRDRNQIAIFDVENQKEIIL
jgi:hypothetical protein